MGAFRPWALGEEPSDQFATYVFRDARLGGPNPGFRSDGE